MAKTLKKARKRAANKERQNDPLAVKKGGVNGKKKGNYAASISDMMQAKKWDAAIRELEAMQAAGQVPKLGSVMRWVRAADLAGQEAISAQLLAAIMRAAAPDGTAASTTLGSGQVPGTTMTRNQTQTQTQHKIQGVASSSAGANSAGDTDNKVLVPVARHPPWVPASASASVPPSEACLQMSADAHADNTAQAGDSTVTAAAAEAREAGMLAAQRFPELFAKGRWQGTFGPVPQEPSADSGTTLSGASKVGKLGPSQAVQQQQYSQQAGSGAPPGALPNLAHDVVMYCTLPGTVQYDAGHPAVTRHEVPFVPGAFLLEGVLSSHECAQLLGIAEAMGFTEDPDYVLSAQAAAAGTGLSAARSGGSGGGERGAAGVVWLADESLQGPLYGRVAALLPQVLGGGSLAGINARWRLYRYDKGAVYRPHVDGAWPGSGIRDGHYVFDAYGDRWSRLTFLLYLNDGFEGGNTTFYLPAAPGSGACLDAHSVKPRAGNVLVFPHGDTMGSLVHEGAAVTRGVKYVIRTDVLYMLPKQQQAGGKGAGARP